MCIIVIKPAGIKMPAMSTLENCWYNNNDGAGFMYATGGTVHIEKGFMSLKDLREKGKKWRIEYNNFPISTLGWLSPNQKLAEYLV